MITITDLARMEILLAMYTSIDRMNQAIARGSSEEYQLELNLQQILRDDFKKLSKEN